MRTGKIVILAISVIFMASLAQAQSYTIDLNISLDQNPPVVSDVSISSLSTGSATIIWRTNVSADSQIEYGTTTSYGTLTVLDSTLTTSHSAAINGLSSGTTYHFRILSADTNGFFNPTEDYTFTTTRPVVSNETAPATNNTPPSSIPLDSVTLTAVIRRSMDFATVYAPSNFPIKSITVKSSVPSNSVQITLTKIESPNVKAPRGIVYRYIRIDSASKDISDIEVLFDVPVSWIAANGFNIEDIRLVRYETSAQQEIWNRMDVTYVGNNVTHRQYRASLPGFSLFAIVGDRDVTQEPPAVVGEEVIVQNNNSANWPLTSDRSPYPANIQYFIISGALFVIAVLLILYSRRRHKPKENVYALSQPFPAVSTP